MMKMIFFVLLGSVLCGCSGQHEDPAGRGGRPIGCPPNGRTRSMNPVSSSPKFIETTNKLVCAARMEKEKRAAVIRQLVDPLKTNFTWDAAVKFSDEAARHIKGVRDRREREDLFGRYRTAVFVVMMPPLAAIERCCSRGEFPDSLASVSNDLNTCGLLIERSWMLGSDPLVDMCLVYDELPRIKWARREASLWKEKGRSDIAELYTALENRFKALLEADGGPARVGFEQICRKIDASVEDRKPRPGVNEVFDGKKYYLDRLKDHLGYRPPWAEDWLRNHRPHPENGD